MSNTFIIIKKKKYMGEARERARAGFLKIEKVAIHEDCSLRLPVIL
jgi:hypothetical protein